MAEYTRQARENGVGVGLLVSVTSIKRVLEWLEGDIEDGGMWIRPLLRAFGRRLLLDDDD